MTRVTNAPAFRKKRKKLYKQAKGYWGDRKNHPRQTKNAVMKAMAYNYEHRKQNKRNFRALWIVRIAVAAKMNGISYSKMIDGLKKANISVNRKMLSQVAIDDPKAFSEIANLAKITLAA
jgi:large subunit ribosomal protein L20